jgi:hypothetical protein
MNRTNVLAKTLSVSILAMLGLHASAMILQAQAPVHLSVTRPGGMPGVPVVTGVLPGTNSVTVTWDGPSGYYRVQQKSQVADAGWQTVGAASATRSLTLPGAAAQAFFRVSGPAPRYAGAEACAECHEATYNKVAATTHTQALEGLREVNHHLDPSCLPCHTVGFQLPTGFTSEAATPHLAGVQCENCHGPAANHAANDSDLTARPRQELAAQVCGGCHSVDRFPTYQEWELSKHVHVTEDMNPSGRISNCGRCHSGSARLSMIKGTPLPAGDANVGITCAVCHDPHAQRTWVNPLTHAVTTNQLRNPVASTNDFFLSTADTFSAKYNENINICGQCHNHRGASWATSSRPPHHSPQYNMMLGTVGEFPAGTPASKISSHGQIEKQCVSCHMPKNHDPNTGAETLASHTFAVSSFDSCRSCHPLPELLLDFSKLVVTTRLLELKGYLDRWATQKAPAAIQKYGTLAWEYDNAGQLSNPRGTLRGPVSSSDPTRDEQKYVPEAIKKARFNLYLVAHDASSGVHNPAHTIALLDAAETWIAQELNR